MLCRVRSFLVLAFAAVLSACGPIDRATTRDTVVPSPGQRVEATVTRVVDGDTIHVALDGGDVTIRLIGVDTPETVAPGQPIECYGPQSSRVHDGELSGRRIALEFDRHLIDPFERTLAYVWLGDELFNEMLVRRGLRRSEDLSAEHAVPGAIRRRGGSARATGSGMWGAC